MAEPRVEFRNVRKTFRRRNRSDALRDALPRLARGLLGTGGRRAEPFVALDGVSFSVAPGEVLGIVGANGAGKSTSLRLAAGIYRADGGEVAVRGRAAALIELSAGFHPDLSGRENVHLAGALLGLRRRQTDAVFDRIVEFADIGDFLESPVHTYSSGMAVRLGFAVAAHVPAEVLLVDEVLAVGDLDFQVKCLHRMAERRQEGVSVLFVSHNLATAEQFCDRVVYLDRGRKAAEGTPREVIATYRRAVAEHAHVAEVRGATAPRVRRGTGVFSLEDVRVDAGEGTPGGTASCGGTLRVTARWKAGRPVLNPLLGVAIHGVDGPLCAETTSAAAGGAPRRYEGEGTLEVLVPSLPLLPGDYEVSVYAKDHAAFAVLDQHQRLYPLRVTGERAPGEDGVVSLRPSWTIRGPGRG